MRKSLTWEQKEVVAHNTGHALVKAVPGSGKTTTIIKRIERMVKSGINPRSILILMYNKSAQLSVTEKLNVALNSTSVPEARTFHSLALKIIKHGEQRGLIKRKKLITPDNYEYEQLVKTAFREAFEYDASYIDPGDIEEFELFITRCRAAAVSPDEVSADPAFSGVGEKHKQAYRRYCELLDERSLRTFDDSLNDANAVLQADSTLGRHFKYIIVDEYQDVNLVQHNMIRFLTKPDTSVMAVGDVNQSIYMWRGSRPDFIDGLFEQHFKGTKVYNLSCTFRFGHHLSLIANSVIRRNATKLSRLCVSHPNTPKTKVQVFFENGLAEVLAQLKVDNGTQAILSRTKASLAEAEIALRLNGIPYQYLAGNSGIHSRSEVGLLVGLVALSVYGSFELIEGHPKKQALLYGFLKESGFHWKSGQLKMALDALKAPSGDPVKALRLVCKGTKSQEKILDNITKLQSKHKEITPATEIVGDIRAMGLLDGLGTGGVTRQGSNDQERGVASLESLLNANRIDARTFLDLILQPNQSSGDCEPFVLATLHGSKGLEWDSVILIGLDDAEFPGGGAATDPREPKRATPEQEGRDEDMEEERRLFYVGITRSKHQLALVVPPDEGLIKWLNSGWDAPPKRTPVATRFVYEAGLSVCAITSEIIYTNAVKARKSSLSKFHKWYLDDLEKLRV